MSALTNLKALNKSIQRELKVYRLVLQDHRTPWTARILLGLAISYFVLPIDIFPDFIPVLGQLDDLLIVPGLVFLALRLIPREAVDDCRAIAGWDWNDYLR